MPRANHPRPPSAPVECWVVVGDDHATFHATHAQAKYAAEARGGTVVHLTSAPAESRQMRAEVKRLRKALAGYHRLFSQYPEWVPYLTSEKHGAKLNKILEESQRDAEALLHPQRSRRKA